MSTSCILIVGILCIALNTVLALPVDAPVQYIELAEANAPITLLDVENGDQSLVDFNAESESQRTARGLGLLSGKFGGLGFGHGLGLKGFGGLGGHGGLGGFGGLHGLGGFGFKPLFGKKFF